MGDLSYDLRPADVWPEFAAGGKDTVTLRHVLLYTAGVPGLPAETTVVFAVRPAKVLAFTKGTFTHTRHRF